MQRAIQKDKKHHGEVLGCHVVAARSERKWEVAWEGFNSIKMGTSRFTIEVAIGIYFYF